MLTALLIQESVIIS